MDDASHQDGFVSFLDDDRSAGPAGPRGRPRDGTSRDGWVGQEEANRRLGETIETTVPASKRPQHDPERYRFEKIIGTRTSSGRKPLKRLNAKHRNVIALHLRCLSGRDISEITGFSESTISQILADPLAQEVIGSYVEGINAELEALMPLGVDAVRTGLMDDEPRVRLLAADRLFKATGRYAAAEQRRESAEDVLARALARVALERERSGDGGGLRELQRSAPVEALHRPRASQLVIEGHVEDVSDDAAD